LPPDNEIRVVADMRALNSMKRCGMNFAQFVSPVRACDPVAAAVEEHLRNMESEGHGELAIDEGRDEVTLTFGGVKVRAENYDIALVRLAGALLDDEHIGLQFLARVRSVNIASH
jgi:hypothetical protein